MLTFPPATVKVNTCYCATYVIIPNDQVWKYSLIGINSKTYTHSGRIVLNFIKYLSMDMPSKLVFILPCVLSTQKYISTFVAQAIDIFSSSNITSSQSCNTHKCLY